MARGTQHRKSSSRTNARVGQPASALPKKRKKAPKQATWEDQLFFSRLRAHAKWVFVLLAMVFAFSFVIFGVGSGSSGIADAMSGFFNNVTSSGSSLSSLQKKVKENKKDAAAWRALATKLETDQKTDRAIVALDHYVALKPKDQGALEEVASLALRRARDYSNLYFTLLAQNRLYTGTDSAFVPGAKLKFSKVFADSTAGFLSPISDLKSKAITAKANEAAGKLGPLTAKAALMYKRLVKLDPKNATNQFQLGQTAEGNNDTATAKAAYKAFLELAPNDALAPTAKAALKRLNASSATSAKGR